MVSSNVTLASYCESVVKVMSIRIHNRAFLLHTNPKRNTKYDNHVHKITFRIPPFHPRFFSSITQLDTHANKDYKTTQYTKAQFLYTVGLTRPRKNSCSILQQLINRITS